MFRVPGYIFGNTLEILSPLDRNQTNFESKLKSNFTKKNIQNPIFRVSPLLTFHPKQKKRHIFVYQKETAKQWAFKAVYELGCSARHDGCRFWRRCLLYTKHGAQTTHQTHPHRCKFRDGPQVDKRFFLFQWTGWVFEGRNNEECCRDLAILWQCLLHFVMFELIFRRCGFVWILSRSKGNPCNSKYIQSGFYAQRSSSCETELQRIFVVQIEHAQKKL